MVVKEGKILDISNGNMLLYNRLSYYYLDSGIVDYVGNNDLPLIVRFFSKFRLLNRLFRIEPRVSIRLDESRFIVAEKKGIKLLDIKNKSSNVILSYRKGFSAPINFCKKNKHIFWGDYGNNPERECVNIYQLDEDMRVNIVYSFPPSTIRHIHNIIYDEVLNKFWILTGDNETVAGIYSSDIKWDNIESVKTGNRKYRAVVAFPHMRGLLYATDSVDEANGIFYINEKGEEITVCPINGTCIYGTEISKYYIFSTCVESPEGRGFFSLLSNKLAKGVHSREVHIIAVAKINLRTQILYKFKKDKWPMKLFQYGTATFPNGQSDCDGLWCYPIACNKYDGKSIYILTE